MILAVTACPTGIAHTYMAAEALETKGKELGYFVKAETNGSGGVKNILTKEEIEHATNKFAGIIGIKDQNFADKISLLVKPTMKGMSTNYDKIQSSRSC